MKPPTPATLSAANCWLLAAALALTLLVSLPTSAQPAAQSVNLLGRQLKPQQEAAPTPQSPQAAAPQTPLAPAAAPAPASLPNSGSQLQAQLTAMQAQAQRQFGQLNGLMLSGASQLVASASPLAAHAANLTGQAANKYGSSVLEALANVGKAIHNQIVQANNNPNGVQIVTGPMDSSSAAATASQVAGNSKKNEYQSIVANDNQQLVFGSGGASLAVANGTHNYREQGEVLRQEIMRRASQLQQVVASSMDMLKNNGDLIVRRLLEQLNHRLDQAKSKADKIINEPATNEVAIKALGTINQGLNNLNSMITNIVNRLDMSAKEASQHQAAPGLVGGPQQALQRVAASPLLDPTRFRLNFQQLGQQLSSAINNASQHQRQWNLQQHQQQPQVVSLQQPPVRAN